MCIRDRRRWVRCETSCRSQDHRRNRGGLYNPWYWVAQRRDRKNAVTLVVTAFLFLWTVLLFVSFAMLPTCYLPVAYLTIFKTSHTDSNYIFFFTIKIKKSTAALRTTVLSRFVDSLIKKVLLELASVSSFLDGNSNACKINTYRHFCCLLVSYSPILVLFQHFSDRFYTSIPS